ncbi:MarR family winged helix-turn-helix transcriptional regulator [Clostridiaceae bacterium OttesenSCG-928-D20]|nr:MarR family winged helix-turn-helix transcriptional regulator [Clostridiaceae bacterium OttesenSCG-928-D20]
MATAEQIDIILEKFEEVHSAKLTRRMDGNKAGMGAVLRLLSQSKEPVSAGQISEALGVSTARVAVLLKKMSAKSLITKETSEVDARITIVRLTETGLELSRRTQEDLRAQIALAIDTVGLERLTEVFETLVELQSILCPPESII